MAQFSQEIALNSLYLHFPVRNGSPKVTMQMRAAGQIVREFSIELAENEPVDWWAFYDVRALSGKTIQIIALDELPAPQAAWLSQAIQQSDKPVAAEDLYHEKYRPQFHFTSRRGWNNDPNGLVYAQGNWHLFYQHNPFGIKWGNMHWGHALSQDLVHWSEQPEALFQKSLHDMAWSGGGLLDTRNSAGWKTGAEDPLVVAFTSTGRGECLAYSLDRGQTLVEYPGNPILEHQGRDPKIIWYEAGQHWVMIVYEEPLEVGSGAGGHATGSSFGYAIYTSTDLKHWTRQTFIPNWYECPELFEIGVEGQPGVRKWVLYGCLKNHFDSAYLVGSFDGKTFIPEMQPAQAHFGPCFYAAQIFSHAPDQRSIMIGWLKGAEYPGMPFSQGMTVPLELKLQRGSNDQEPYRLCFTPVKEFDKLHVDGVSKRASDLVQVNALLSDPDLEELLDLRLELETRHPVIWRMGNYPLTWAPETGQLSFAGRTASLTPGTHQLSLRLLIDRSVSEVFADEGRAAFAAAIIFPEGGRSLKLEGDFEKCSVQIDPLHSIWD